MRNLFALMLTLALVLTLAACGQQPKDSVPEASMEIASVALEDLPVAGGWQRPESPEVTDELRSLLDRALEGMTGASYIPVAYLGSQVVAGTNYALLCRVAPVVPDPVETFCVVYLYEDLEGHVELTQVDDSLASTDLSDELLEGGWAQPESPVVTEEARSALESALEGMAGVQYTPLALVSSQVVAGMNYCILCQGTAASGEAVSSYALVYVYQDLEGSAEVTRIVDFSGEAQTEEAESAEDGITSH